MNPTLSIKHYGQQIWLDNLSRTHLREGLLARLVEEDGLAGVTSNPSIFFKAVSESPYYRDEVNNLYNSMLPAEARYEALVIADIRQACDLLICTYKESGGGAGYVSLEVSPHLAYDEEQTVAEARRLRDTVERENLLIKVPATPAGIRAFERLIAEGININVTLMFSLRHVEAVAKAYIHGAKRWVDSGGDPHHLKSVASIFLSRVDTLVDKRLTAIGSTEALARRGKAAVALGKLAYQRYLGRFHGESFSTLANLGIRPQQLLWASTSTKNPDYNDLLYVEPLIGPETVNTLPDATLAALRDHGEVAATLKEGVEEAQRQVTALAALGIELDEVGEVLQVEGINSFSEAYDKLINFMKGEPPH
ncbi:MAG TPA: transaldolase [Gammaproteobacteria bacterium]